MKEVTIKTFDVFDETLGRAIVNNLKTFEEAEAYIIAHDKKTLAYWQLASLQDPESTKEFERHRYLIYHSEGKIITYADNLDKMSFAELCKEVVGWRAISVVEFRF